MRLWLPVMPLIHLAAGFWLHAHGAGRRSLIASVVLLQGLQVLAMKQWISFD